MLPCNINNLCTNQTDEIVECINAGIKNIEQYCNYRKKHPGNLSMFNNLFDDIIDITYFWTGNFYVGYRKEKVIETVFQNFYNSLYELLINFKNTTYSHMIQEECDAALKYLYQGKIYRYIGYGNSQDCEKPLKIEYDNIWVSWSKEPNNSYFETKLYGKCIKLYATIENEKYGIDLESLGSSRNNEREVVFPTIKETINKEISFKNYDFDPEDYEEDESFVSIKYEESYTSKSSSLDGDYIPTYDVEDCTNLQME